MYCLIFFINGYVKLLKRAITTAEFSSCQSEMSYEMLIFMACVVTGV